MLSSTASASTMSESDVATASKKRSLELEAFASLVDALRAAGPLTQERKALLQQTATSLRIPAERYKAEIRRTLAGPSLNSGPNVDETSWAMEGRRNTFMLPRKAPRSTLAAPYAAYTTRLLPALRALPKAPCRSVETQTLALKPIVNPKLVVVSSPRSQTTHTVVYAKPSGQRQVRISSQQMGGHTTVPVAVASKLQGQKTFTGTLPAVTKAAPGGGIMTPVNAQQSSQHLVVSSPIQHSKQIVITTPNNIVHKISSRGVTHTLQVRPTAGTPVVTKVLNPNRTGEFKLLHKARGSPPVLRTTSSTAPSTTPHLTPIGVRLNAMPTTNGKHHMNNNAGDCVPGGLSPSPRVIKSVSQWNYDDHSVMAKPAAVAPSSVKGAPTNATGNSERLPQVAVGQQDATPAPPVSAAPVAQSKIVQIVQTAAATTVTASVDESRGGTPGTPAPPTPGGRTVTTKPVRVVTPRQVVATERDCCSRSGESKATNVVVQSLPYQDYQGSIYKMVPDDVIIEEEVV